jgi:hypothetical protein
MSDKDSFSSEILAALDELRILSVVVAKELEKKPTLKNCALGRSHLIGSIATCIAVNNASVLKPKNKDGGIVIGLIETIAPVIMWAYLMGLIDAMEPSSDKILEEKSSTVIQEGSS